MQEVQVCLTLLKIKNIKYIIFSIFQHLIKYVFKNIFLEAFLLTFFENVSFISKCPSINQILNLVYIVLYVFITQAHNGGRNV